MIFILISLVIFLLSIIFHIWLHRWFKKNKIITFKTALIFLVGWWVNLAIMLTFYHSQDFLNQQTSNWWTLPLPLTSVFIFALLSVAYIMLFLGPFLGSISPTFKIILLLHDKKTLTKKDILSSFSNFGLSERFSLSLYSL